ncbi:radical SAM protein [Myxococcota bacterium]|nr:radical SAM protein [Myxococcota bacterium]
MGEGSAAAPELAHVAAGIRAVHRGHAPNCSSSGSVVGVALVSAVAATAVVNAWALRFLRWAEGQGPPGAPPRLRREADGSALLALPGGTEDPPGEEAAAGRVQAGAILHLEPWLAAVALAAGAVEVGPGAAEAGALVAAPSPTALVAPTEVHLAVTDRCPARCAGCYLEAGPERPVREPGADDLRARLDELAAMGVLEVAFGGGEGLLRADLLDLLAHARGLGLVPNLTTSGFGLSPALARRLAPLVGQVNVSLDGLGPVYRQVRGWDGAARGLQALCTLAEAGCRVGVNTVITRPLLEGDALEALGRAIEVAGADEWQWLRFKPVGRGEQAWSVLAPTAGQARELWPRALRLEAAGRLGLRFDCALVPFLVAHQPPADLVARLGLRGCPGGHSLWARDAAGAWAPCSFAPGAPAGALAAAWREHAPLRAWRDRAAAPPEPCASCAWAATCRGGCRAVSAFLVGDPLAPDPECPRVRAAASVT